jgi:hypothetical protein
MVLTGFSNTVGSSSSPYQIHSIHHRQVVNTVSFSAWRPLKGPLFDWPLAICDASTFEPHRDGQDSDAVYPEWAYEHVLVHKHENQKWYYFSAMLESETILFKCADSKIGAQGRKYGIGRYCLARKRI